MVAPLGWLPEPEKPDHDPATERVRWDTASLAWVVEPLPPEPEPQPRPLTLREFVKLGQSAGGMTNAQLVAARDDPNEDLRALWVILEMSEQVDKGDPDTQGGLALLDALGYLPNGAQAVLDAWPTA